MTGIFVSRTPIGKSKCARCGKLFTPKKAGDRYGSSCARIVANNHIEVKNEKGETVAVII